MIRALVILLAFQAPSFEVVSIKPNKSGDKAQNNRFDPQRAIFINTPLQTLLVWAYRVRDFEVLNAPAWVKADRWDIEATTASPATMKEKAEMLKPLLADRFKLKFHRETRELIEYRLSVSKSGSKLQPGQDNAKDATHIGRGLIENHKMNVAELVQFLTGELGKPVIDTTGLTGVYDVKLQWIPDEGQPNSQGEAPSPDSAGPTVFTAIQEQLGLKLEATKGPVEVFVVDHVEKPSAN